MLPFDVREASTGSLPRAKSDPSQDSASADSFQDRSEDALRDVAGAIAIMSSIEGLSGFFSTGHRPMELAPQQARPGGEHGVLASPQARALSEDSPGDLADAVAIMSSIEGLSGFLCMGHGPTELAQQQARPAREHGVLANPQDLAEERKRKSGQ